MIERAIWGLAYALALVAGISVVLMMLQTVADVLMTDIFGRPIEGNLEISSIYHMVIVVFLPLAMVELRHENISADILVRLFPPRVQQVVYALGQLVCAVFFAILAYQTWQDAVNAWRINEIMMGSTYVTIWPARFALPLGFTAVMLVSLLHAWKGFTDRSFDPVPPAPEIEEAV